MLRRMARRRYSPPNAGRDIIVLASLFPAPLGDATRNARRRCRRLPSNYRLPPTSPDAHTAVEYYGTPELTCDNLLPPAMGDFVTIANNLEDRGGDESKRCGKATQLSDGDLPSAWHIYQQIAIFTMQVARWVIVIVHTQRPQCTVVTVAVGSLVRLLSFEVWNAVVT